MADGGDRDPIAAAAVQPSGPSGAEPERSHRDKKEKKEKKHKHDKKHKEKSKHKRHKKERHRSRTRSRTPPAHGSSDDEAGAAVGSPAGATAAVPDDEAGRGGEAAEPASPLAGAAKPAATAAIAVSAGAEDEEEGELPADRPPSGAGEASRRVEEASQRDRRSRSPDRRQHSDGAELPGSAGRDRRDRSRSRARSRSQRRDPSGPAASEQRSRGDRSHDANGRDQERDQERDVSRLRSRSREGRRSSRSPERRRSRSPLRRRSHSPERRPVEGRGRSRSLSRRDRDIRGAPLLPPRDRDYRRELDRRDDRRQDYGRDSRFSGPGMRYEDRLRFEQRRRGRSRSMERSRDTRKRSRSDERRQQGGGKRTQEDEEDEEEFQRRVAAALEQADEEDEDKLIEERRRRREEILAKHRSQQNLDQMAAAPTATELSQQQQAAAGPGGAAAGAGASAPASAQATNTQPAAAGIEDEGEGVDLWDDEDVVMAQLGTTHAGALNIFRHDGSAAANGSSERGPTSTAPSEMIQSGTGEATGSELGRRLAARQAAEPGIFADDGADDIFAATPTDVKEKEAAVAAAQAGQAAAAAAIGGRKALLDNYDDAEGYYNFQVGELIGEPGATHFEVYATHGKGVFSSVLRARDLSRRDHDTGICPEVAIKVIRANETMYKAGQMERVILRKLGAADPDGKRHCIRMLGSFEYRNHLCLVFEAMDMNLRELTKRYGRGIGLSINAVRVYAQQMLVALYHLKNCGVLHADIKPDNILVNDRRTVVKLCDFGSAMFSGDNEITPYLVSRFYRAPEVILGLPYEYPMDMWSIGCVVYELFTGHILFAGKTNNEMLKLMMDVKGPFPKKMIKKAEFAFKHFESDPNMSFALLEEDPVTKRPVRRLIPNPTVKKDFAALLASQSPDRRKLAQLVDLLERMMQLDPDRRISPKDALRHPFIKEPPSTK